PPASAPSSDPAMPPPALPIDPVVWLRPGMRLVSKLPTPNPAPAPPSTLPNVAEPKRLPLSIPSAPGAAGPATVAENGNPVPVVAKPRLPPRLFKAPVRPPGPKRLVLLLPLSALARETPLEILPKLNRLGVGVAAA